MALSKKQFTELGGLFRGSRNWSMSRVSTLLHKATKEQVQKLASGKTKKQAEVFVKAREAVAAAD